VKCNLCFSFREPTDIKQYAEETLDSYILEHIDAPNAITAVFRTPFTLMFIYYGQREAPIKGCLTVSIIGPLQLKL
jgi:hypothetical protein